MGSHFLWNPINDNIVKEFDDAGNTIADYTTEPSLHGEVLSQHRDGVSSFYHSDGEGNVTSLTDKNGNVTDTLVYNACGEVTERTGSTVNPFQFLGQKGGYKDAETGEYILRSYIYNSSQGRLLSILRDFLMRAIGSFNDYGLYADKPRDERPPGAPGERASEGSVCALTFWTQTRKNEFGDERDIEKEPGYKFLRCQAKCAAPGMEENRIGGVRDVVDFIERRKCCTLYVCGHQGGMGNLGGAMTIGEDDQTVYILGPKAKLEGVEAIRNAFYANGCKDCVINIFACGTSGEAKDQAKAAEGAQKYREKLALITGCTVCGSTRFLSNLRQANPKDDGGILGVPQECPDEVADQKGRPAWKYQCARYDEKKDPDRQKKEKARQDAKKKQ